MDGRTARRVALLALFSLLTTAGATAASPIVRKAVCLGEVVTIFGTSASERIEGTPGRDVIHARGGDDVVLGGDRRDRICGGTGDDRLDGRYGDDLLKGGHGDDHLIGGPGNDLALGEEHDDSLDGGDGDDSDTLVGGPGSDTLTGGDGRFDHDFLFGGDGGDWLDGGIGGRDELHGGRGDDYLSRGLVSFEFSPARVTVDLEPPAPDGHNAIGEGNDYVFEPDGVVGSDFGDVITDAEDDVGREFRGRGGADAISAHGGPDRVDGGPGNDDLDGGTGADTVWFEDSPDGVTVTLRDRTSTGAGADVVTGFESVVGSYFDDHVTGDDERNSLAGSYGDNVLFGLSGDDVLRDASDGDAGEGFDECWSLALDNCERWTVADPPSLPFVIDPAHLTELEDLGTIRGGIAGGLGGPNEDSIVASIRRMTPDGCSWWDSESRRFVPGGCRDARGTDVPLDEGRWRLRVGISLKPGTYRIQANWHDERYHGDPCAGVFAPTCVQLEVR